MLCAKNLSKARTTGFPGYGAWMVAWLKADTTGRSPSAALFHHTLHMADATANSAEEKKVGVNLIESGILADGEDDRKNGIDASDHSGIDVG